MKKSELNKFWELFPGYLIDNCEGEVITEEFLQQIVAKMLEDPQIMSMVFKKPEIKIK
jgi:ubiquinone biosynthesis protein Coq4